jgi:hypothetical protein
MTFETIKHLRDTTRETDAQMKSRQEKFGITFTQINDNLDLLCDLLNKHIASFNIEMRGKKHRYWVNVNAPKRCNRKPYSYILITGKGTYFEHREVITFCDSGFIGFCGEADSTNEMPILHAFGEWLEMIGGAE